MQASPDQNRTFSQLLDWHVRRGTRPDGSPESVGVPSENKEFARAVGKVSSENEKGDRTIRNWRSGETLPGSADLHGILQTLFGGKPAYTEWQSELSERYHAARAQDQDAPAPVALASVNAAIPTKPLRCLGRDDEVKSVVDSLIVAKDSAAVLVLGSAGMGKTTLTKQAANEPTVTDRFGRCRWFVELETAKDLPGFETEVVRAVGLDPKDTTFDGALEFLAGTPGLLILDNLETPWEADMAGVERRLAQLAATPGLVLLTSIRGGEAPAGLRWTRRKTVEPLEAPHDRDLFLDIAHGIAADDPDLAPLLAELGGIPLAIELVAMRAQAAHSLKPIRDEWQRIGSALAQRPRVAGSRLTSLDISLELSVASPRLGDAGRRLFAFLGQLPAGVCDDDVAALLGDKAFEARQGLTSSGLGYERDGRLDLLPPVRDHARRLHPPHGKDTALWWTHFLALALEHEQQFNTTEGAAALARLAVELPNLDAALRAAMQTGGLQSAVAAHHSIGITIKWTGMGTQATIRELAAACHAAGNFQSEANCIESVGDIALARSDHDVARKAYEESLLLYREVGDILGEANCIASLGDIALRRSDHDAARGTYEEALRLYRKVGNILGEANCIRSLGDIALRRSDHDAARKAFEEALPLFRKAGDILGEANCIQCLGDVALARSDHDVARKAFEEALLLYRKVGDIHGGANCIQSLGDIALACSEHDAARKAYEEALAMYERIADPYSIGLAHLRLALLCQGKARSGHLEAARAAWTSIGRPDLVAMLEE